MRTQARYAILPVLALAHSVFATPIVTPGNASASANNIAAFPGFDPQTHTSGADKFSASAFSSNGGGSHSDGPGNKVSASSGFNDEFFFRADPLGPADLAHLAGNAKTQSISITLATPIQATATSFGSMSFTVTDPVSFHLTGYLSMDHITAGGPGMLNAMVGARFYLFGGGSGSLRIDEALTQPHEGSISFDQSGILSPGRYFFESYASVLAATAGPGSSYRAEVSYDVKLEFASVPAPASITLLAAAPLATRRRRR